MRRRGCLYLSRDDTELDATVGRLVGRWDLNPGAARDHEVLDRFARTERRQLCPEVLGLPGGVVVVPRGGDMLRLLLVDAVEHIDRVGCCHRTEANRYRDLLSLGNGCSRRRCINCSVPEGHPLVFYVHFAPLLVSTVEPLPSGTPTSSP